MSSKNFEKIISKVQKKLNIASFNAMQINSFESISNNRDTLLISRTGSGKTLAFLLPLLHQIDSSSPTIQLLVIIPTRELAIQISNVASSLGLGFNILTCYGGNPVREEKRALERNPQIVVGTPGRILDHLDRENLVSNRIRFLVLDEFDKTLEMGFHKQMQSILQHLSYKPQYILTSATSAIEIPRFVPLYEVQRLDYSKTDEDLVQLDLKKVISQEKDKIEQLLLLLLAVGHEPTFVFCNYRESVERISTFLAEKGIENDKLHGGLDQIQRENVMSKFRNGSSRILIATDLASRGLDVPEVKNIVHYHLPSSEENFIHRNGRTARMEKSGKAFVLIYKEEETPDFIEEIKEEYSIKTTTDLLPPLEWQSVLVNKGKRDKINKIDIVGFLSKIGNLEKGELGKVEVKKKYAIAAVKREKVDQLIELTNNKKVKGKKALVKVL